MSHKNMRKIEVVQSKTSSDEYIYIYIVAHVHVYLSHQSFIPNFVEIGQSVPVKIF